MRALLLLLALTLGLVAADKKVDPAFVSSDEVEITASLLTTKEETTQALGAELPKGVVAVLVKVRPKGGKPLPIDRDDFVLVKSDDGQRSAPFAPSQLAGNGGLTLQSQAIGGWAAQGNGPIWGGVGGPPMQGPGNGSVFGNTTAQPRQVEAKSKEGDGKAKEDPLLALLKAKSLPEKPASETISGLLYFPLDGKIKLKNLSLFYKAPSSKLELRFQR